MDLATAGPEEVDVAVSSLDGPEPALSVLAAALPALARRLRAPPLSLLLAAPGAARDYSDPTLLVRALLANPAVRLVLPGPPGRPSRPSRPRSEVKSVEPPALEPPALEPPALEPPALEPSEAPGLLRVRPASRARALDVFGRERGVAAEETVRALGFATARAEAGLAIRAGRSNAGDSALAAYGGYTPGLFYAVAAAETDRPPELPGPESASGPLKGFVLLPEDLAGPSAGSGAGAAEIDAALRSSAAAAGFYLGAAWAVVGAWFAAVGAGGPGNGAPEAVHAVFRADVTAPIARDRADPVPRGTWRDAEAAARLDHLLARLTRASGTAGARPPHEAPRFDSAPLAELVRLGALEAYRIALVSGRDAEALNRFVETAQTLGEKAAHAAALEREAAAASAEQGVRIAIVADKLGAAKAEALLRSGDPDAALARLGARERELVEAEFGRRLQARQANAANRCPHVRLAVRLRRASSAAEAAAAYAELSALLAAPARGARGAAPAAEWILCRRCGWRALCPHVRERLRLEARGEQPGAVRTQLQRFALRVASQDAVSFFCRVCGESLGGADDDEALAAAIGRFGALGGELRARVWALALEAAAALRFPVPTDERVFAAAAADAVFPLLQEADLGPRRSETKSARSPFRGRASPEAAPNSDPGKTRAALSAESQIEALVYVYAYVLSLLDETRGKPTEVGFSGLRAGAPITEAVSRLLGHLATTGRSLLAQVEGLSPERLKDRLADAFRRVRGAGGASFRPPDPEEGLAVQLVELSPVYAYASRVARVAGRGGPGAQGGRGSPRSAPRARDPGRRVGDAEFSRILGVGIPELIRKAQAAARDPALAPLLACRAGAAIPGGDLELVTKSEPANLFARLYRLPSDGGSGRRAWCAAAASRQAKANAAFTEGYRLYTRYTCDVVSEDARAAFVADLAQALACEASQQATLARRALVPERLISRGPAPRLARPAPTLAALYDAEGRPHDWNSRVTYVYRVSAGAATGGPPEGAALQEVPGGPKGVAAARAAKSLPPGAELVDLRCPTCGELASRVSALEPAAVARARRARAETRAFFAFFEARCPLGDLHAWERGTCQRCGLAALVARAGAAGELVGTAGAAARAFLERFGARFAAERQAARSLPAAEKARPPAPDPALQRADALARSWTADYGLITRAAELAGTAPAVLEALGATAGRDFADVLEGRDPPTPPESPTDPRLMAADAQTRLFLSEYSRLRFAARLGRPGPLAAELLAAVPAEAWGSLPEILPELGADYCEQAAAMRRLRSPADSLAFSIHSLCAFSLEAARPGPPEPAWAGGLGRAFAKSMLERIVQGQRLFSRPGPFAWELFEADDQPDQVDDASEDVPADEGEEASADPFSGADMDYDTSENNPNNEIA